MKNKSLMTEIIISVLLFLICASICIAVLLSAYATSLKSERMITAVELAGSAVEELKEQRMPQLEQGEYTLTVDGQEDENGFTGVVRVYYGDDCLIELPCATVSEGVVS